MISGRGGGLLIVFISVGTLLFKKGPYLRFGTTLYGIVAEKGT